MEPIKNPFRKNSAAYDFCEIVSVDWKTGYSKTIPVKELAIYNSKLALGNGGSWCRDDGPLGKIFNIRRKLKKGKIISIKLNGFSKTKKAQLISAKIKDYFKNCKCAVLNIGGKFIEIDHKDGRKDNSLVDKLQRETDFQPLHKSCNIAKRGHCQTCKETGIRFDATDLGFSVAQWIGPKKYSGSCIGCYWYDILEWNKEISKYFIKKM